MAFSKSFPKTNKGYNLWEEVELTKEEEIEEEKKAIEENIRILKDCIDHARRIMVEKGMKPYQNDLVTIGVALFEKSSSHQVYWKERRAREKFKEHAGQKSEENF